MTTETQTIIRRRLVRDISGRRVIADLEVRLPGASGNLSPAFSLTGEVYERHGTWSGAVCQRNGREPDSCGQVTGELLRAFPSLAGFARMHLSDPETGTPMHALANAWYFYAGSRDDLRDAVTRSGGYTGFDGIYAHQLAARDLPDDDDGRRRYCYAVACDMLRVSSIPDMPELDDDVDDTDALREISILREQAREAATGVDVRDYAAVSEAKRAAAKIDREADKIERALITEAYASVHAAFSAFVDDQRERWAREAADALAFIHSLPEDGER